MCVGLPDLAKDGDRPEQPDLPGDIMVDVGFNLISDDTDLLNTEFWPSKSVGIYYMRTFKINNYFTFNPALGLGLEKYGLADNANYVSNENRNIVFDTITNVRVRKNKLAVTYLDIPMELRFYPRETIDGEGLFIGVGGVIGFRVRAHTKVKYDLFEDTRIEKTTGRFGLSDFRYGLQIRAGWKGAHLFFKQYFSPMFNDGRGPLGAEPTAFTLGINITGF
jgi:hypothetical protein